jgi:muconolactone delta-isomerase
VVLAIPPARVGEVARELFRRGEYPTLAEFVGTVGLEALFAALGAARPHDLLAVVPLLEWNDNLDHVIRHLPEAQIEELVTVLDPPELAELAEAVPPDAEMHAAIADRLARG